MSALNLHMLISAEAPRNLGFIDLASKIEQRMEAERTPRFGFLMLTLGRIFLHLFPE